MTIEEKLRLLTGKNLWQTEDLNGKVPSITFCDGPHGLRKMLLNENGNYYTLPSNAYPNFVNLANTWNIQATQEIAELIGEDCIENNVDVLLAPGLNIKRTPLCGRNFEYFSEDPYLAGVMGKAFISGLHNRGVMACVKHFCANNRETGRNYQSSEIDERTLHDIYLTPFEIALTEKPEVVMSSYCQINGVYASENKKLLKNILRDKMHFRGLIISDWLGIRNSYKALKAGLDLRMPYFDGSYEQLKYAYDNNLITDDEINSSVVKILETATKSDAIKNKKKITKDIASRRISALKIAEESIVLLKNNDNILPLRDKDVCVISNMNVLPYIGGGGAAFVNSFYVQKPLNVLLGEILQCEIECSVNVKSNGLDPTNNSREGALIASKHNISIVIVGDSPETESEGYDRSDIKLSPKEEDLINSITNTGTKTVVIIEAGSAIDCSKWIDKVDVVIFAGYLGDNCNQALANILTGKTNPSGKLSESFPISLLDTYCKDNIGNNNIEKYSEGIFVGYRYYDTFNIPVRFPFGFGLSYSKFSYSDLSVKKTGETNFSLSYKITNLSDTDGKEISQVYVKDPVCMVTKPEKELKAFSKDFIKAHETKTITVMLDKNAFSHYDVISSEKYIENGEFIVMIGSSVNDIKLKKRITISLPEETQYSV
ncbi:MAG: glycoside hydrolase family 3 C-terminal domain-containing protein [Clostridia bacterium]|nr:glycoside hydrolase family 3 C-terminal domain-containing protein [Clostridia bacterium]